MENLDLLYAREFILDYLRLRMEEEVFHFAIINQIKDKVKQVISAIANSRQNQEANGKLVNNSHKKLDKTLDVVYQINDVSSEKCVLFRIQIGLSELPNQPFSATVNQIIDCIETFLNPSENTEFWRPTIQGKVVQIGWNKEAKPIPLLVLEQREDLLELSPEGSNLT